MQAAILRQQGEKLHSEVKAGFEKLSFDQRKKKEVEVLHCTLKHTFYYTL